jgi:hypothetical protein
VKIACIILLALAALSTVATIAIDPAGESFGRGWNVVMNFLLWTAVLWLGLLVLLAVGLVRCWRRRPEWRTALGHPVLAMTTAAILLLTPFLNLAIIRIKAVIAG